MEQIQEESWSVHHDCLKLALIRGARDMIQGTRMVDGDARLLLAILCPVEYAKLAMSRRGQAVAAARAETGPATLGKDGEIANLLASGLSSRKVASQLGVSQNAVMRAKRRTTP